MRSIEAYAKAYSEARETLESLACFAALAHEQRSLARRLPEALRVVPTERDPYACTAAMLKDIANGRLFVYSLNGPKWETKEQTIIARSTHDYFGHYLAQSDFSWQGEIAACVSEARFLSLGAKRALEAEVLGQAACYLMTGSFPEQKRVLI